MTARRNVEESLGEHRFTWTSFDAETKATLTATQGLYREYAGLLDTKPTPEAARIPVSVDMERLYIETFHVGIADLDSHGHPGCSRRSAFGGVLWRLPNWFSMTGSRARVLSMSGLPPSTRSCVKRNDLPKDPLTLVTRTAQEEVRQHHVNQMKSTEVQTLGVMAAVYALRMTLC